MSDQWHYSQAGQKQGPVPQERLQQLAASGQLQPTDMVWRDGMDQWAEASTIPDLFAAEGQAAPPPLPPTTAPSEAKVSGAAVADKVRQVGQKAKDFAQSEQVQESVGKAKAKWHGLSGRGKLISVAVGLLVIWLVYRFLFGGGGPPYQDLVEHTTKARGRLKASLLKEYNVENIRAVPARALEAATTESQRQIDEIASKYKPLPITLDESAQELISDIESFPPVTRSSFLGPGWEIPLKFTARSRMRDMNSGLVCKLYDDEGLVCEEVNVWTETAGSPGDRIHARLAPLDDDDLGKACKLRIFGGN